MTKSIRIRNPWEAFPGLEHLSGDLRKQMEFRRRHRAVRYGLFRLRTAAEGGCSIGADELPDGFADYFASRLPAYQLGPKGERAEVHPDKIKPIGDLFGFVKFADKWDVDENLQVYLRHASIHQEWNARLAAVVPILGD